MTQTPEEWTIAALADRKPGIKIAPLRPAALKPYQEAFIRELLVDEHEADTAILPVNGGYTPSAGNSRPHVIALSEKFFGVSTSAPLSHMN